MDRLESPRTQAQRPRLPPELTDVIIKLLRANQRPTLNCALVCRSWVPASRRHLFWRTAFDVDVRNCSKVARLLSPATCTIKRAIQHLVVSRLEELFVLSDFGIIACQLSNVTHFTIIDSDFCGLWSSPLAPTLFPLLRNVVTLEPVDTIFDEDGVALYWLLRHCPHLQRLTCSEVGLSNCGIIKERVMPPPPTLDQTRLVPNSESTWVQRDDCVSPWTTEPWMSAIPRFTMLDVSFTRQWSVEGPTERLLETVGPSLQVFGFTHLGQGYVSCLKRTTVCCSSLFYRDNVFFTAWILRRFVFLTQLRSFTFDFRIWQETSAQLVIQGMRHLTSNHLQELIIRSRLSLQSSDLNRDATWTDLDVLMDGPRFSPTLRSLTLRFSYGDLSLPQEIQERERWAHARFPRCAARGILRVGYVAYIPQRG
jgi:hypothetical protein